MTVDWVVLTAAVVGLAIAAYTTIQNNSANLIQTAAGAIEGEDRRANFNGNINRYTTQ